ncbi:hypothetical protein OIY81_1078 [Cryptosporidium canis]|uniref:Uncharacterized protein n=1 Tax=Cryptosporidium canis TaxID=195482 RepID=A0ABQ8P7H7_9CRYT|nr:hypothetical protein OJ252_2438 [Cryptosporidium canis]KAJ1612926.1 hypothetical protein OIY81_1078 [Cryptosporidium canis]
MILLSLIGAYEPILNPDNLKFIVQNIGTLTGKEVRFIKDSDSNLKTLKGRYISESNPELIGRKYATERSEVGIHQQISTCSMLEILFKIKSKLISENNIKRINSDFFLIGITCLDIFPTENHEYVFGQSDPEKGIAIISAFRLCKKNESLTNSRILKMFNVYYMLNK